MFQKSISKEPLFSIIFDGSTSLGEAFALVAQLATENKKYACGYPFGESPSLLAQCSGFNVGWCIRQWRWNEDPCPFFPICKKMSLALLTLSIELARTLGYQERWSLSTLCLLIHSKLTLLLKRSRPGLGQRCYLKPGSGHSGR